jgi:uncharacterized Zn finger protein
MTEEIEKILMPCPFCGSQDLATDEQTVKCKRCGATATRENWNARTMEARWQNEMVKQTVRAERYKVALEQIAEAIK